MLFLFLPCGMDASGMQSGDLATSSSELAVARVRIWLAELAVPNTGLAVLLRFAHE